MIENGDYNARLEKKIDSMQTDIRTLSDHLTRLTFINEAHQNISSENRRDLDALGEKVRTLEHFSARLDGGLNTLRLITTIFACVIFALCGWFGSNVIQNTQDVSLLRDNVSRHDTQLEKLGR